jgi:hypothetical protein
MLPGLLLFHILLYKDPIRWLSYVPFLPIHITAITPNTSHSIFIHIIKYFILKMVISSIYCISLDQYDVLGKSK